MFLKTRRNSYKGFRSSLPEAFCEKDVLKSFSKFTGKQLLWGLVLTKLQAKKRLQRRWLSLDIAKFSRTPFFIEYFRWLLLRLVKESAIRRFRETLPIKWAPSHVPFIVRIFNGCFSCFTCYEVILSFFEKVREKSKIKAI